MCPRCLDQKKKRKKHRKQMQLVGLLFFMFFFFSAFCRLFFSGPESTKQNESVNHITSIFIRALTGAAHFRGQSVCRSRMKAKSEKERERNDAVLLCWQFS